MNKPSNFGDLLRRITPYIHLEEARVARKEEVKKFCRKGEGRRDREDGRDTRQGTSNLFNVLKEYSES